MAGIDVYRTKIGQLNVKLTTRSPAAFVVKLEQTHFVHPDFTALFTARKVTHTNYHCFYFAQCRISHHTDTVGWVLLIVHRKLSIETCRSVSTTNIALLLHIGEYRDRHIEHIVFRPDSLTILSWILVVLLFGSQFQRNFVLVIVILVVGTQADEYCQLIIGKIRNIWLERIGMHKHLQTLVLPNVERSILVDGFRFFISQIMHRHGQSLLVALHKLWLWWVLLARDAWRKNVVYRCFIVVFLDTHCSYRHCPRRWSRVGKVLLILAPLSSHEVERSKAHNDRLFEVRKEHSHKANACEIANTPHPFLIFSHRNAELIPRLWCSSSFT